MLVTLALASPVRGDVNGDRKADLVVGGVAGVTVGAQRLPGKAVALSTGDFDKDGLSDLVVGGNGGIQVRYGSRSGLGPARTFRPSATAPKFDPRKPGNRGRGIGWLAAGHGFGNALTTADFNRDGYTDLAVGAPETDRGQVNAGVVVVMYGSRSGLTDKKALLLGEDVPGVLGFSQHYRLFGAALAAGDVTGDGYPDLVVTAPSGRPGHDIAAAIHVFRGSAKGVSLKGDSLVSSGAIDGRVFDADACSGGPDGPTNKDNVARCTRQAFGWSVRTGRFTNDRYADVLVGIGSGKVLLLRGNANGVDAKGHRIIAVPGVTGTSAVAGDSAGQMAAGDIDKDGYSDLAVGSRSTGKVAILYGSATGPQPPVWVPGGGMNVALLDVDGDGRPELATTSGDRTGVTWFTGRKATKTAAYSLKGNLIAR